MEMRLEKQWSRTVGDMLDTPGCCVWVRCAKCAFDRPADLEAIAARRGRDFSLINVRAPCPCGKSWVSFVGASSPGSWAYALHDEAHGYLWHFGVPLAATAAAKRGGK